MRRRIANELGVELYDIYGLTEVYGPGIAINCRDQGPMHYWDDFIYIEIVNPKTGEALPDGEVGEIVITTLKKEGAPSYATEPMTFPGLCLAIVPAVLLIQGLIRLSGAQTTW